jgi:hypothetical protein
MAYDTAASGFALPATSVITIEVILSAEIYCMPPNGRLAGL